MGCRGKNQGRRAIKYRDNFSKATLVEDKTGNQNTSSQLF